MQLSMDSIKALSERLVGVGFRHYASKEEDIELISRIIREHLKEDAVRSLGK